MPLSKTLESRPGWKTIEEDLVAHLKKEPVIDEKILPTGVPRFFLPECQCPALFFSTANHL